jgi:hypothetical protein
MNLLQGNSATLLQLPFSLLAYFFKMFRVKKKCAQAVVRNGAARTENSKLRGNLSLHFAAALFRVP